MLQKIYIYQEDQCSNSRKMANLTPKGKCSKASIKLKAGLSPSQKIVFIYVNERPLKVMKNAFYFMLKAHSVLEIFTFLSCIFDYVKKRFDKRVMVTNNYITQIVKYLTQPDSEIWPVNSI